MPIHKDKTNRNLRVIVCASIFPNREEMTKGIYIFNQVKELSVISDVLALAPIPYVPSFLNSGKYGIYKKVPYEETIDGLKIIHPRYFITPKVGRWLYGFFYFFSLIGLFSKLKKKFKPDAIIGYWAYPDGFACSLIGKMLKVPVIIGCRGCDVNDAKSQRIRKYLTRWGLNLSQKVMAVSKAMKDTIIDLGVDEKKIAVISNGVDPFFKAGDKKGAMAKLGPTFESQKKNILFCGRVSQEKGIEYLIDACSLLKKEKIAFSLIVVGDGAQAEEIRKKVLALDLKEEVKFSGEVSHDNIKDYMIGADILCLPSLREGCPNVALEALACGLPVVASNVGGVPEIITHEGLGFLVPPKEPTQLKEAIKAAFTKKWDKKVLTDSVVNRTWADTALKVRDIVLSL